MPILGIHCGHNSSAALMVGGRIVGAVQEERFTKIKNQMAFPTQSIKHLLSRHLQGNVSQIKHVALFMQDIDPYSLAVSRYSDFAVHDHIRENHEYWNKVLYEGAPNNGIYWRELFRQGKNLNVHSGVDTSYMNGDASTEELIRFVSDELRPNTLRQNFDYQGSSTAYDHHFCHAMYAFYGTPISRQYWCDTLVLTADSWGDGQNWSAYLVEDDGNLKKVGGGSDHGVARIYRSVTLILGMKPHEHEYKVMGLSGYSRSSKFVTAVEDILCKALDFRNGKFVRDLPLKDYYFDLKSRLEGHRFDNIASALQNWATRVTGAWMGHWLRETNTSGVCFSGGLSMNIKSNGDLLNLIEIKRMSVPASGGDETGSIGACFAAALEHKQKFEPINHVYLGAIEDHMGAGDEWETGVLKAGGNPSDYELIVDVKSLDLAKLLAADFVLARCVGSMEFGARALGNRSILANPKNLANIKFINEAIKNRDFWMPFTPSILEEEVNNYIINPKRVTSSFMTIGFSSTPRAHNEIPAALHPGDLSVRPQFVGKDTNLTYWQLISDFQLLTGIPALLNTSLNLHGDPMNASVADASRTLALSGLEALALSGNRLLVKKSASVRIKRVLGV
jgi:carbamoyltransferase